MNIADTINLYGGSAAIEWLLLVKQRQYGHGSELVEALGLAGRADNVYAAQKVLAACIEARALIRCRFAPTRAQLFFDVNGSLRHSPDFQLEAYHYAPGPGL